MNTDFHLSINKPCSANWNEMNPTSQGRFCGLCNHTVVDFSKMSDEEIKEYFRCHATQKTCGRFLTNQLSVQNKKWVSLKSILIWGFTLLTFMIGCRKPPAPRHKMGKVDTIHRTGYIEQVK